MLGVHLTHGRLQLSRGFYRLLVDRQDVVPFAYVGLLGGTSPARAMHAHGIARTSADDNAKCWGFIVGVFVGSLNCLLIVLAERLRTVEGGPTTSANDAPRLSVTEGLQSLAGKGYPVCIIPQIHHKFSMQQKIR